MEPSNTKTLETFSCRDCIAGRERGHGPTGSDIMLCGNMQLSGICGKEMLAQLIKDKMLTINITVTQ